MGVKNPTRIERSKAEHVRMQAARVFAVGSTQADVARLYKVSRNTASRWYRAWKRGGVKALEQHKATGRPPQVEFEDIREFLRSMDLDGHNTGSIAEELSMRFGVEYDKDHVGRILRKLGYSWSGRGWGRG